MEPEDFFVFGSRSKVYDSSSSDDDDENVVPPRKARKKETRSRTPRFPMEAGSDKTARWRGKPELSTWSALLQHPEVGDETSPTGRKFRRKFRLPYSKFLDLLEQSKEYNPKWADKPPGEGHGKGPARHPFRIKALSVLRMLAKGLDYDDLEDITGISESSYKVFVPQYMHFLATVVYAREVKLPNPDENPFLEVFARLGFPGAYCCIDGVHLSWDNCPVKYRGIFTGKEQHPTLAFNVAALMSREIIHCSKWMPGGKNDKTQGMVCMFIVVTLYLLFTFSILIYSFIKFCFHSIKN
jgi:hypothetical protein